MAEEIVEVPANSNAGEPEGGGHQVHILGHVAAAMRRLLMSQRNTWILLGLLLAACGDDATGGDASVADGSVRDAGPTADAPSIPDALPPIDGYVAQCTPAAGTSLTTELVAEGLHQPIFVTSPPGDARLFIVEKCGRIRILDNGTVREQPFLSIGPGSDNPRVRCTAGKLNGATAVTAGKGPRLPLAGGVGASALVPFGAASTGSSTTSTDLASASNVPSSPTRPMLSSARPVTPAGTIICRLANA